MREYVIKTPSLAELLTIIEGEPGGTRHLFRGQGSADWGLVPSLYRRTVPVHSKTVESAFSAFEAMCITRFFEEGAPYLPALPRGYTNDRVLAQHFGVPTRLLDWSHDPFVAAYFAVEDWQVETNAAIFMILPDACYRPEDVRSLGPHKVIEFAPSAIDRRIPAQKSAFTFHPYGEPDSPFVPLNERADIGNSITTHDNKSTRGFAKVIIPHAMKRLILAHISQVRR